MHAEGKKQLFTKDAILKYLAVIFFSMTYSLGVSFFVTPMKLYSGGLLGLSQLIRTFVIDTFNVSLPANFDLAGIIYYAFNIPLLIMAFKKISLTFTIKTILSLTTMALMMSLVTPEVPLLSDTLTSCVIGGIVTGASVGFILRVGGSGGGLDILGMYLAKNFHGASVGKVSLTCNLLLYIVCAILFNIETAIYSIIITAVSAVTVDKMHYQNIMVEVMIFSKVDNIAKPIMQVLHRGVTEWTGKGAYTDEGTHVLVTVISKYEITHLRRLVLQVDPKAFITYSQISSVDGNFMKRL